MELVGRNPETGQVEAAVAAARDGESRVIAVVGEAGIGKSALLDAAADLADEAGMLVLRGRAAEHEREAPFALVIDAFDDHVSGLHPRRLEALGPELGAVLPAAGPAETELAAAGAGERIRHNRNLRSLLELLGHERPVALLLDDLHWADEASAEFVLHLLRRPPRVGFLLMLGLRPGEVAERIGEGGRRSEGWTELRLGPLTPDQALALLPDGLDPGARERVVEAAGGNPLFLEELARHGTDDRLPETLAAAVRQELAPLPGPSRALAEGAAIAGDPFNLHLAAAAADVEADAATIDALVGAGLIEGKGGRRFRFRHPLVHRAIADSVPPGRRLEAHERVAAALERAGASPGARAVHVEQIARPGDQQAAALLLEAAREAERKAPRTTARWYRAAVDLLPHDDREGRAAILVPLAATLAAAGDLAASREAIDEGIATLSPEQAGERAELTSVAATVEVLLADFDAAKARLATALDDAPPAQRPRLLLQRGGVALFTGDVEGVLDWAEQAERELEPESPASLRAASAAARGFGLALRGEAGIELVLEGADLLAQPDDSDPAQRVEAIWTVGGNLGQLERFAASAEVLELGLDLARETSQEHLLGHLHTLLAMSQLPLLRLDDALEHARSAEELAWLERRAFDLGFALSLKARVLAVRGDAVAAERAAIESDQVVGEPGAAVTRSTLAHNAVVRLADDPERLLRELEGIAGPGLSLLNPLARAGIATVAARAALTLDRLDEAERLVAAARDGVRGEEPPVSVLRVRRAEAELSLARGERSEAAEQAEQLATEAEQAGLPQEALEAGLLQARALLADERRDVALELLQRLAGEAAGYGALALRDTAARELRRAGSRVSSRARRAGADGELTEREREIAELVASGRSNKQVAATLFISEKTVERHLSSIYSRLGIRGRVELPRALDEARGKD